MSKTVLFLCTGNYYRSRFAECLFNHLAPGVQLDWTATSRALAIEVGNYNVGEMSPHTRKGLAARSIPLPNPLRMPVACSDVDLSSADLIVALKEAEHRPLLTRRHPNWPDKVHYWHVHDLDASGPDEALQEVETNVRMLIEKLSEKACR